MNEPDTTTDGETNAPGDPRAASPSKVGKLLLYSIVGLLLYCGYRGCITATDAAGVSSCVNNMKQIGIALHMYHEEYGTFPPAYIADENGRPMHSWRVLILPFMDEQELYDEYRFDEPWDGPNNSKLADRIPPAYRCPNYQSYCKRHRLHSDHIRQLTNYVGISDPAGVFSGTSPTALYDIPDGSSDTLMVVEVRQHAVHWMEPQDVTLNEFYTDLQLSSYRHQANHQGNLRVLLADGSTTIFGPEISLEFLKKLVTCRGDEDVSDW